MKCADTQTPPPLLRRSVIIGPSRQPYLIRSGERTVGTILATDPADAVAAFSAGRPALPTGFEISVERFEVLV